MSDNLCVRCSRPTADGWACAPCAYRAGDQLHELGDMTPAGRDVAHGFARHGSTGGSGKPGSQVPIDLRATEVLTQIQARLSTWVGEIAHARSRPIPAPRHLGDDPIIIWARWLAGHVEWIRKTDDAERFLIEVDECARAMRSVVRGPSEQKYLGPCGAAEQIDITMFGHQPGSQTMDGPPCDGDVYASRGSRTGRCRVCGAEVSTAERAAWLDAEVRSHAFRASQIADAYGVNVNTIRTWAHRGQLVAHGHDADGRPLFNVGDVLDLAAGDAVRRHEAQQKRARRAAERAERMTA